MFGALSGLSSEADASGNHHVERVILETAVHLTQRISLNVYWRKTILKYKVQVEYRVWCSAQ